jgi:predicted transcriptional regulator of viral defense system
MILFASKMLLGRSHHSLDRAFMPIEPFRTSLPKWVDSLAARGITAFSTEKVEAAVGGTPNARKLALNRLIRRRMLFQPHHGYFVVVPPEYREVGSPPPLWYIDGLMRFLRLPYRVGLLSAAALYGAAHQQPQVFQVVTSKPIRQLRRGPMRIMWLVMRSVSTSPVREQRTPNGYVLVSSPAATALDLVQFPQHAGGLNNVATVLQDLVASITDVDMRSALEDSRPALPTVQRLGYLLSLVSQSAATVVLLQWLAHAKPRTVPLSAGSAVPENASRDDRWGVIVNHDVEPDTDDDGDELPDTVPAPDDFPSTVAGKR